MTLPFVAYIFGRDTYRLMLGGTSGILVLSRQHLNSLLSTSDCSDTELPIYIMAVSKKGALHG